LECERNKPAATAAASVNRGPRGIPTLGVEIFHRYGLPVEPFETPRIHGESGSGFTEEVEMGFLPNE
jgi:hypothetical protein